VIPAYTDLQRLQIDKDSKQQQVDQQTSGLGATKFQKIESQLQQKEATKQQILALFAQEKNLSTILLDISNIFKSRNVKLISFQPQALEPVVVSDSSLGSAVNNKLKRQTFNVKSKGTMLTAKRLFGI